MSKRFTTNGLSKLLYNCLFLAVIFLLSVNSSFSQVVSRQVIGQNPFHDGGFEGQTVGNLTTNTSSNPATHGSTSSAFWVRSGSTLTGGAIVSGSGARTGSKYAVGGVSSTSHVTFRSPYAGSSASSIVVQFYYRGDLNNVSGAGTRGGVGTTTNTYGAYTTSNVSNWTLYQAVIGSAAATSGGASDTAYVAVSIKSGSNSAATSWEVDDVVMYNASAIDNTAPNSPGSVSATAASSSTMNVSWSAPTGGVDGGGYVVLRYATNPNADNDPNQNGIYAIGNTTTNGTGGLTGTVVYIGTGTSFTDNSLSAGTTYYYKVYAVDKAFNYSLETSASGTTIGATPSIALSSSNPAVGATNIQASNTKKQVYAFSLAVTSGNTTLNSVSFTTTNSSASDITKYQLWYSTSNSLAGASQIGSDITTGLGTGPHSFSGLTQAINLGTTGYLWITVDAASSVTGGNTLSVSAITTSDLTFDVGNTSGTASAGGIQTFVTVPGAPTIGTATSGNAQASVAFTAPASNGGTAITSYTVTSNPGGIIASGSTSPITVNGLTNGTAYTFVVTATNTVGTGSASNSSNSVTPYTVPAAPTIGTATPGNGQVSVAFSAPGSNGGSAITSYTVTSNPGGITASGSVSPITLNGLTNGTAYTFTVVATNAAGNSAPSNASSSVTPYTLPDAPSIGTAVAGNANAVIAFIAPASNGGSAITSYTVTSNPGGITATGSASPITVTGLTNGTAYTFTVTATNAAGTGTASSASNSVTPASGPTAPGVPSIGSASVSGVSGTASVSFTAPNDDGGSSITGYTVTSNPGGITATGVSSPITLNGLTNGTAYTFTVTATNAVGSSLASASSNSVTPYTTPDAPTIGVASVSGVSGRALVAFTAPVFNGGSSITGYTVTSNPGGITATGVSSPITLNGLTNGTAYTFTVVAANAAGNSAASAASNSVTPFTVPDAPVIGTASAGFSNASISFTAPVFNGGSTVTSYTVTSSPGNITASGASSPITINGLTPGTSYTFTIVATNAAGNSVASAASNSVTPYNVPGAPTGVTATAGNATATISFSTPSSNGSAITGYTVTSNPGSLTASGSVSPITINGLTNGTAYTFTVIATNAAGNSAASSASNSVTPVLPPPIATAATSINSSSFTANWGAVANATSYNLYISSSVPDTVAAWTFPYTGTNTYTDSIICAGTPNYGNSNFSISSGSLSDAIGVTTRGSSATTWTTTPTKFFQVIVNTTNYKDLTLSFAQQSSGSGPKDFRIEYKTSSGGTWTPVTNGAYTIRGTYSGTTYSGAYNFISNLTLPVDCNNLSALYIRWIPTSSLRTDTIAGGAIAAAGTSRLDDIFIKGNLITNISGYNPASISGTSTNVTGVTAGTTYNYYVTASSASNTSAASNIVSVKTNADPAFANYRTKASGNFSDVNIWEYDNDGTGTTFISAPQIPGSTNNITIRATDSVYMDVDLSVNSGKALTVLGKINLNTKIISGAGSFVLSAGASGYTGNATGFTGSLLITSTTRDAAANYIFNGTIPQAAGLMPNTMTGNVIIDNPYGVTLVSNKTLNSPGTLIVKSNAVLNFGTGINSSQYNFNGTGNFTAEPGATIGICNGSGIVNDGINGSIRVTGTRTFNPGVNYVFLKNDGATQSRTGSSFGTEITSVNNMTFNNPMGSRLNSNISINGTLTLTSGKLNTDSFKISIANGGSLIKSDTAWVVGTLEKNVAVGSPSVTYEVGPDSLTYTPVSLAFNNVTSGGAVAVNSVKSAHPNLATSLLNSSKRLNYYLSIMGGAIFSDYAATATFNASNILGSANTAALIGGVYSNGWSYPAVGTRTSLSTQLNGLNGYGALSIAELNCTLSASASNNGPICSGNNLQINGSVTTGGYGSLAYSWSGPSSFTSAAQNPQINNIASANAGVYTLTVTDSAGCQSTATTTVSVTERPAMPNIACYQTATFNTSTCSWDVTGTQPTQPTVACYQTATWNGTTCQWDVTGTQPTQPTVACYQTATFNTNTCSWDVTGTQPTQPTVACYQTATWNGTTCQWDVTGTQPTQPTVACYQTATFNTSTCSWDVTGTQPTQPSVACYQTATFNTNTCSWDVTGTQPTQPTVACYQTATFNTNTCSWDVTGTQPTQPSVACYQTATFNTNTCSWDVTGTQPTQPTVACYQTATWNGTTCQWVVTGSPIASSFSTSACGSYTLPWGITVSTSGTYTHVYTSVRGCDSTVTANVTINAITNNATNVAACNSYTWNGTTYTTSGTYTFNYTNAGGCASVDTLRLVISTGIPSVGTTPNVITGTLIDNTCGARRYRYSVPVIANALTYTWSFVGSLGTNASVDSGTTNSRVLVVKFTSNNASAVGDSIRLTVASACGSSKTALKLINAAMTAPTAPVITQTAIDSVTCGARRYRYSVPAIVSTTANATPTGYLWSFTGSLGANAFIDSGTATSRVITVTYTSNDGAITGDSVKVSYTTSCTVSTSKADKLRILPITSGPATPASITITAVAANACGTRVYRYTAPALAVGTNGAATPTGYVWSFVGSLGQNAVVDSGSLNGRVVRMRYSSNDAAMVGDSVKLFYTSSACGNSPALAVALTNAVIVQPAAPAVTATTLVTNVCSGRKVRYSVPVTPAASTTTAVALGYSWSFVGTGLNNSLNTTYRIDSMDADGLDSSRVIVVQYLSDAAAASGDSVRCQYTTACGAGAIGKIKVPLATALAAPVAPVVTATSLITNVCGGRKIRYAVPVTPSATATTQASVGYDWSFVGSGLHGTLNTTFRIDSMDVDGLDSSRVIVIQYLSNDMSAATDSVRCAYRTACGNSGSIGKIKVPITAALAQPAAPVVTASVVVSNVCGGRKVRYSVPVTPSATTTAAAATGYDWSFVGNGLHATLNTTYRIDSADAGGLSSSRVIVVQYLSNDISASTDSVRCAYTTACGSSAIGKIKAPITAALAQPAAPVVTATAVSVSNCGGRTVRYSVPVTPSATTTAAAATGYDWSFVGTGLHGSLNSTYAIDSADVGGLSVSRVIVVRYLSPDAASSSDSVRCAYTTACGTGAIGKVKVPLLLALTQPVAPVVTATAVTVNSCGSRKVRYAVPVTPAAVTTTTATTVAATGYDWSFVGTGLHGSLNSTYAIDSMDVGGLSASRVIVVRYISNIAAATSDSVKCRYTSSCGSGLYGGAKPGLVALSVPVAPLATGITQTLDVDTCGTRTYRFVAPALTVGTATNASPTGYVWSFSNTTLGNNAVIDSGTTTSQKIRVRFTNLSAATANDLVNLVYSSGCGNSAVSSKPLANAALATLAATTSPGIITATIIDTSSSVCGRRKIRFSVPVTAGVTSYKWTIPTAKGAVIDSGAWSPVTQSATVACGRTIVVRFTTGTAINASNTPSFNTDVVSVKVVGNSTTGCITGTAVSTLLVPKLVACNLGAKIVPIATTVSTSEKMDVVVYPNPTNNNFNVQVVSAGKEAATVRILDMQGRYLKTLTVQPNQTINVGAELKTGSYFIEVRQGKNVRTTRVLKL